MHRHMSASNPKDRRDTNSRADAVVKKYFTAF